MMGTDVMVRAAGDAEGVAVRSALDRMATIAVKFDAFNPESPLFHFNHHGTPLVDQEIIGLTARGLEISRASAGAFDMTVAPLLELWGFNGTPSIPAEKDIRDALLYVGCCHLEIKAGQLMKDVPGVRINLGGIAKGYALAEAVRVLKEHGIVSALVDAGGDICVIGRNGERLWNIGIRDPYGESVAGSVAVENMAVMGSGDYERFFIQDGRRYHHILDPRTGYPSEGVAAVTVIHPDPVQAQAWSKVPFVLGPRKALGLMERAGMAVVVIFSSGEMACSNSMRNGFLSKNAGN